MPWVEAGASCGTSGQSRRIEAVKLRLTGDLADQYEIYYQGHVQNLGWLGWASHGTPAGTSRGSLRVEGFRVKLVAKKGGSAPTSTSAAFIAGDVQYRAHVQSIGDQAAVKNGATAGTTGKGLRVEALHLALPGADAASGIECRAHVQNKGWLAWAPAGQRCGTAGQSLRVEAIQVRLTGQMAKAWDVYYRTHAQSYGWLGWAKNGAQSGTSGGSKRLEGVQIVLVGKGRGAPGSTANAFVQVPKPVVVVPAPKPVESYGKNCPADRPIKGNQNSRGEWIYHVPGGGSYAVTVPEDCFATAAEASAAGYRAARN